MIHIAVGLGIAAVALVASLTGMGCQALELPPEKKQDDIPDSGIPPTDTGPTDQGPEVDDLGRGDLQIPDAFVSGDTDIDVGPWADADAFIAPDLSTDDAEVDGSAADLAPSDMATPEDLATDDGGDTGPTTEDAELDGSAPLPDGGNEVDGGAIIPPDCNPLEVKLDEVTCVTDPRTAGVFGQDLPRKINVLEFRDANLLSPRCPSRDTMLHENNKPLFIKLMADWDSIPAVQTARALNQDVELDVELSDIALSLIDSIDGDHLLNPAEGFVEGGVGVWETFSEIDGRPIRFDAAGDGLQLSVVIPGYICTYKAVAPY